MMPAVNESSYALLSEVRRYLRLDAVADVKRLIELDGLPATRIPTSTRAVAKIYLPSLHAWLLKRTANPDAALRDYAAWRTDFLNVARGGKEARIV